MTFKYYAIAEDGGRVEGEIETQDLGRAFSELAKLGYKQISLSPKRS